MEVQELLDLSDRVGEFYSERLEEDLKNKLNELLGNIEKFINEKSVEEGTVLNNSVYKSIIPFTYKSRVKSQLSIEEKIIRNDIKISEITKESLLLAFDDLIGITILTTTIGFQEIAFKYLKNFIEDNMDTISIKSGMDTKKSIFNNQNIQYYHIKLEYMNYPIEIQIKSVFLSAFADIEHTLFYKDHGIHELKNYNKQLMHSLAPLLINIEEILHGIYTYDITYIESEMLKTKIYTYIETNKNEIFEISNDKGRLGFVINQISQILCSYFIEQGVEFDENIFSGEMANCRDKKIINHFYKDSLSFNAISKLLDDDSDFLKTYLVFELKLDKNYREKIDAISEKIDIFFEVMLNVSENDIFKELVLKKNTKLKELYQYFETEHENFIEEFQYKIDEESTPETLINFVNSSLLLYKLMCKHELLASEVSNKIESWFLEKEEYGEISYGLSESIVSYILERWNE